VYRGIVPNPHGEANSPVWTGNKAIRRALDALREQLGGYLARLERVESAPTPGDRVTNLENLSLEQERTLKDFDHQIKELTFAVSEGIERTDRAERRIRNAIQRARKELASRGFDDPGLEAEAHELRIVDGDGGDDGGVPAVPAEVAEVEPEASSIRGVSAETLRRRWGV